MAFRDQDRQLDDAAPAIGSRYGRTTGTRRRERLVLASIGAFALLVAVVWVIWVAIDSPSSSIETGDRGYVVNDDRSVDVKYSLTVAPGTETVCVVQALDDNFGVIGWKTVEVPASDQWTRGLTETVRTTQRANTGLIYRCWLP
ncbi:DUF4307 domain-containing protein [Mycetocola reblochoni]|uniref:DUF4307 domain-containing protein n=2 Tax=Mycetocola reblochoni TaxID=331618 RepID=A0A1R4IAZ6_9MICO|nr:DUF4307 domain-containing protein [Mycetocola reblochoni]RLP67591.1 DUF4307 domain-containing protein [Mycetocola reblochoni]SJN16997.1 hypothetical protein FM119_00770 [Mycetocola reblochoni REB411]